MTQHVWILNCKNLFQRIVIDNVYIRLYFKSHFSVENRNSINNEYTELYYNNIIPSHIEVRTCLQLICLTILHVLKLQISQLCSRLQDNINVCTNVDYNVNIKLSIMMTTNLVYTYISYYTIIPM